MDVTRRRVVEVAAAGLLLGGADQAPAVAGRLAGIEALIAATRTGSPDLADQLRRNLPGLARGGAGAVHLPDGRPVAGTTTVPTAASSDVAAVWLDEFVFALDAKGTASVILDGAPPVPMVPVAGSSLFLHRARLAIGTAHVFTFVVDGVEVGTNSVAGYHPASYEYPGVARGTLSEKRSVASSIFPGVTNDYWLYANAGVDAARGAPVMVWQDGSRFVGAEDAINYRLQVVSDNLVARGAMPPCVHVLVSPGTGGDPLPMRFAGDTQANEVRSLQYDTVSDRYGRFVIEELLADAGKAFKLRQDAYSCGGGGFSSGAVCAFNMAWFHPQRFSRVHSNIGSFTALQWHPDRGQEGGNTVADWVRRVPRKNVRIWISDGSNDLEADSHGRADLFQAGSWPLHNVALANALKLQGYDFHFRFGEATHSTAQGALDLPESLAWLWRDYDPGRTEQVYEQDPLEQAKPIFRVKIANRDAW